MHGTLKKTSRKLSAVSSGRRLFLEHIAPTKNAQGRRFADLIVLFTEELGSKPTTSQTATVRKIATLQVLAEGLELSIVKGTASAKDRAEYYRINTQQVRLMKGLGLSNANVDDDGDAEGVIDPLEYARRGATRHSHSRHTQRERLDSEDS
ncbi:hypothetical protein [Bradyrhizobium sp. CCBAU 11357]|uniref:hypothetical protein n=1 Tax=Bradyrhizobium sp. CCBAU 11357 TaxID=1630808 RepID=UPI0023034524|nr:hypothetical protein [Bradyrhizobium sp. CCBAU 11357]